VQRRHDRIDGGPRRSGGSRTRDSEARLAAKKAATIADDRRSRDEQHGRRGAARLQREAVPQPCMPDDADGRIEALRHRPQWLGEAAECKYGCDRCRAKARTPEDVNAGFCRGQPQGVEDAHPMHQLTIIGMLVLCDGCEAGSGGGQTVLLREECTGAASDKSSRTRRNDMRRGKDPVMLQFLGDPARVVMEADPLDRSPNADLGARAVHTVGSAPEASLAEDGCDEMEEPLGSGEVHDECAVLEEPSGSDELELPSRARGARAAGRRRAARTRRRPVRQPARSPPLLRRAVGPI
ncbi:unnamed protein product, partial [Prorocentrum cordatum]